jgi:hypothetical protein
MTSRAFSARCPSPHNISRRRIYPDVRLRPMTRRSHWRPSELLAADAMRKGPRDDTPLAFVRCMSIPAVLCAAAIQGVRTA